MIIINNIDLVVDIPTTKAEKFNAELARLERPELGEHQRKNGTLGAVPKMNSLLIFNNKVR